MTRPVAGLQSQPGVWTGAGVTVAVIDSGWSRDLDDARIRRGVGLVDPADDLGPSLSLDDVDRLGHGTACADLVLRVAPSASIVPVRVFGSRLETAVPILVAALDWVGAAGIRLANLSLGTWRTEQATALYEACERYLRSGGILVAAHPGAVNLSLPAAFDNVISVAGVASVSGGAIQTVLGGPIELMGPIEHEGVRWHDGTRRTVRGSSYAAASATGAIACMLEEAPLLHLGDVRRFLKERYGPGIARVRYGGDEPSVKPPS